MAKPLRALIVEDSEDDALLMTRELERGGFEVSWERVDTRDAMATALDRGPWDLILSDFRMPHFSASAALALYRERGLDTPFILVSGTIGEEQAVESLKAGAYDFFLKNRLTRLCSAVERELGEAENRRQRRRAEAERQQAEEALRASEAKYRALIEHMGEGLIMVDSGDIIRFVNPRICRMLGYAEPELLGQHASTLLLHEEDRAAMAERNRRRSEGIAESYEIEQRQKSGEFFWARFSATPVTDAEGRIAGSMAIVADITKRKRAEESLRHSRALLDLTGQMAKIGGWELDLTTQSLSWTDEVYRIHELDAAPPMSGAEAIHFYAPEARPVITAAVQAAIDAGTPWDLELPLITAKGKRIWVRAQGAAERRDGRAVRLLGAFQDVTERKRAQEATLAEKAFSDAMLDSLPGIFFLFDQAGRLLRWNRALATISGYSPEELTALHLLDFFDAADRARAEESLRKVFASGSAELEVALVTKDGRRIAHYFSGLRFSVDGVPCCIGMGIDLTARKLLEAELHQAQKIEAIGRLAGGVAHDFNNLLGVILGYGELALSELPSADQVRERVEEMMKAAERAAGLTRQLQAFSRKQILQLRLLDLNALIGEAGKMLGRLIGEDIHLVTRMAADLGTVRADPGQIEQIIMNLAVNARDAMPRGGCLTLETANIDLHAEYAGSHPPVHPGHYVMLAVSDTGLGMDTETQRRVFEPFFTTKPVGEGTGLGLATVYGIVKQSDGYIWVYSESGRGTTFKIYFPRVGEPATAILSDGQPPIAPRGYESVLVVEDSPALREVIRENLTELGYSVLLATDGEDALSLARTNQGPIDLLLTDVVMPRLGGGELARRLGALRPGLRVIFMSGYTDGAVSHQGVLEQGVVLLTKPFTRDQLACSVRATLDRTANAT